MDNSEIFFFYNSQYNMKMCNFHNKYNIKMKQNIIVICWAIY